MRVRGDPIAACNHAAAPSELHQVPARVGRRSQLRSCNHLLLSTALGRIKRHARHALAPALAWRPSQGIEGLLGAAMGGGLEMLEILVKHSLEDINDMPAPDEERSDGERGTTGTALRTAARLGHVETVKYLLDKGADPGLRDARGRTARELAKAKGNIEAVSLLQEH
ncbi:hypothetical protein B0J12DRAFT_663101 [Macrophomina phaseolina]|uniref:Ankyrin repeat-containing domain protein n=1 Tax=Macrophomina phaseolina TaxID=35725 RepID=A0ABQ8GAQ2_9PEZI|nr:hypothetical protein B0J12DRAFT_663101 [Macrophomina phaseolina]